MAQKDRNRRLREREATRDNMSTAQDLATLWSIFPDMRPPELLKLEIKDLDGNVRYQVSGRPNSSSEEDRNLKRKELLASLISLASNSPEHADWTNLDLRGLDFPDDVSGIDFSGSDLSNAKLKSKLDRAKFANCKIVGTNFSGASASTEVKFCGAFIKDSEFDLSNLNAPNFRGARMINSSAKSVKWPNAVFTHTRQRGMEYGPKTQGHKPESKVVTTWRGKRKTMDVGSDLSNADWGRALVTRCDLNGTVLTDDLRNSTNEQLVGRGYEPLESKDFPDKMRGAVFVACKSNAATDKSGMIKGRLVRDKVVTMLASNTSAIAVSTVLAAPALLLDSSVLGGLSAGLGALSLVYFTGFVDFMKDKVFSPVASYLQDTVAKRLSLSRESGQNGFKSMYHNLGVLVSGRGQLQHIVRALEAVKQKKSENFGQSLVEFINGQDHDVVVCDKRHLAEAIAHISSNRKRGYEVSKTISLIRQYPEERCAGGVPSSVTFNKDGTTTLSWIEGGETKMLARFDENGEFMDHMDMRAPDVYGETPLEFPEIGTLMQTIDRFERQILNDNGLHEDDFDYDRKTSYVTAGEQGSIFVHRKGDRKLHNENGPAIMHMKDTTGPSWHTEHFFLKGRHIHPDEFESVKDLMNDPALQALNESKIRSGDPVPEQIRIEIEDLSEVDIDMHEEPATIGMSLH